MTQNNYWDNVPVEEDLEVHFDSIVKTLQSPAGNIVPKEKGTQHDRIIKLNGFPLWYGDLDKNAVQALPALKASFQMLGLTCEVESLD